MLAHSAAASVVPTAQGDWLFSPMWTEMTPPDVYWEPRYTYGYETMNQTLKNLGTGGSSMTAGKLFEPIVTHDFGTGTDYYISSSTDFTEGDGSGHITSIGSEEYGGGATLVFLYKASDEGPTSTDALLKVGGIGWKPEYDTGVGYRFDLALFSSTGTAQYTGNSYTVIESDNQWRMMTFVNERIDNPSSTNDIWRWTTYKNSTQVFTDDVFLSGQWSSYADGGGASIIGLADHNYGSIMRFRYPLNSTQITAIRDYLETKYGTFGA